MIVFDNEMKNILLIFSVNKKWGFPKGKYEDKDESLFSAACRELEEETGLKYNDDDFNTNITEPNFI